jgi:phosphoglucomutase
MEFTHQGASWSVKGRDSVDVKFARLPHEKQTIEKDFAGVQAWAKENNSSFFKKLLEIYIRFGCYREGLVSGTRKGIQGAQEIENLMTTLRNNPPKTLDGIEVTHFADYKSGIITHFLDNSTSETGLPNSNVLQFTLADGSKITARPSGTEPKIKFYFSLKSKLINEDNFADVWEKLGERIARINAELPIPRY